MRVFLLSALALLAFAGNSVLCRLALIDSQIDPASFTVIRLLSGAVLLLLLVAMSARHSNARGSWAGAFSLFIYAALFSFAYVNLDTATGALILFGSVQLSMYAINLWRGYRLSVLEWLGLIIAIAGLVYLLLPDLSLPSLTGFSMMTLAGVAWAVYTLVGKRSDNSLVDTAFNFLRCLPLAGALLVLSFETLNVDWAGAMLAIVSGALTSGLGYAIWYAALRDLSVTQAAVIQLLVPIIAAFGGVVFADELIKFDLVIATSLVLGGILLVVFAKKRVSDHGL